MRIAFADFCGWDFHARTVDSQPMGGSHAAACYLAQALARLGHEIFLLTATSTPGAYAGVQCLPLNATPPAALRCDAFVCLLAAGHGVQLRSLLGPETHLVLWTQHSFDQPAVQALQHAGERAAYDAFVFVSEWQRQEFVRRFQLDPARAQLLRNAVAPAFENLFPESRPILPEKARPPVLAYTSTPFRGLDLLLEAFPAIRSAVPGVRLRVFSSMQVYQVPPAADQAQFGELYRRCRALEGVEYCGSLPQPALAAALREVMVFAYPNHFAETSCIAALEALAAGCAIVTSALGALPETTAGFAWLLSVGQDRNRYLRQFVDQVAAVLRAGLRGDPADESRRRRQVDYIRANATWTVRAAQWHEWLTAAHFSRTPAPGGHTP